MKKEKYKVLILDGKVDEAGKGVVQCWRKGIITDVKKGDIWRWDNGKEVKAGHLYTALADQKLEPNGEFILRLKEDSLN